MMNEETIQAIKPGAVVRVFTTGRGSTSGGEGMTSFEGVVIARKHGSEPGATFTIRAILRGVGVEKIFPIHSPAISKVKIVSSPKKIRRAKLYFVRKISGKKIRQKLGVSL